MTHPYKKDALSSSGTKKTAILSSSGSMRAKPTSKLTTAQSSKKIAPKTTKSLKSEGQKTKLRLDKRPRKRAEGGGVMGWVKDLVSGNPKTENLKTDAKPEWTTPEDIELSKKYDTSYASPTAAFLTPDASKSRQVKDFQTVQRLFSNPQHLSSVPFEPTNEKTREAIREAYIAANKSPVAAVGFDPRVMVSSYDIPEKIDFRWRLFSGKRCHNGHGYKSDKYGP
jgi:hypothetical protein